MAKQVEFEISPGLQKFMRAMSGAIRTASLFDRDMRDLNGTIKAVDKTIDKLDGSKINVKTTADTGSIDRAQGKVDALGRTSPKITAQTDDSAIDRTAGKISALTSTPDVTIQTDDSAVDRSQGKIDAVDGATPKVTVQADDSALRGLQQQIASLNTTATLTLAVDLAGRAKNVFTSTPVLGGIQDQQMAENVLQTSPGTDAAEGMAAVGAVFAQNWGESRVEIAGVVAQIDRLSGSEEDLAGAASAMYELTAGGRELEEVMRSASVLVTTGVAGSFREAADLLAGGFTGPAGTAEDFLDTISEYTPQLEEIQTSGAGFIAFLNEGIAQGAFNTDKLADSFKEANVRIQEAVAMSEGPAFEALTRVGMTDEAEAYASGEITGGEFFEGLTAAIAAEGSDFDLFEIFGSGAEDLGATVFQNIDWTSLDTEGAFAGAAAEYGATMTDTLGDDWKTLMRTLEEQFLGVVDGWTGGIDTWVAETRTKIQTLGAELRAGTGLPEALEIALEVPGLADKIRDFEASIGNFVIELQLVVASVLEFLGKGDAAGSIRTAVADQAANQLEYEIKFADDQEEVTAAIQRAIDRGVDSPALADSISQVATEMVGEGLTAEATALLDTLTEMGRGVVVEIASTGLYGGPMQWETITVPVDPELTPEAAAAYAEQVALVSDEALTLKSELGPTAGVRVTKTSLMPEIDLTAAQAAVDQAVIDAGEIATLQAAWDVLTSLTGDLIVTSDVGTGEQGLGFENLIDFTGANGEILRFKDQTLLDFNATQTGVTTEVDTMVTNTEAAFGEMAFAADTSVADVNEAAALLLLDLQTNGPLVVDELEAIETAYEGVGQAAYDAWVATGGSEGSYPSGVPGRARGGPVSAGEPYVVGERGQELFVPGSDGVILPAGVTAALMSLPGLMGGGGSTVVNNTSIVVNTNINSQGTAQLMSGAGRIARSIRGM
jgi:hypothetical protein